jgi:hypothetical protein
MHMPQESRDDELLILYPRLQDPRYFVAVQQLGYGIDEPAVDTQAYAYHKGVVSAFSDIVKHCCAWISWWSLTTCNELPIHELIDNGKPRKINLCAWLFTTYHGQLIDHDL